jgi:hypothetical protein
MVLPQLPDYEGLNAGTYDPYNTAGGRVRKEKMHRHNGGKIKDLIAKQRWDELGTIGPDLRDRVLAVHNETHMIYTLDNYLCTQLHPMKACGGCKNTSVADHVNNRRDYSSDRSKPREFPSCSNVLSGLHLEYAKGSRNGLLHSKDLAPPGSNTRCRRRE